MQKHFDCSLMYDNILLWLTKWRYKYFGFTFLSILIATITINYIHLFSMRKLFFPTIMAILQSFLFMKVKSKIFSCIEIKISFKNEKVIDRIFKGKNVKFRMYSQPKNIFNYIFSICRQRKGLSNC